MNDRRQNLAVRVALAPVAGPVRVWHTTLTFLVVFAALVIGALAGVGAVAVYDLAHSQKPNVQLNQPLPPQPSTRSIAPLPTDEQPINTDVSVNMNYLPAVQDQGQVGQCQCYAFRYQYDFLRNERLGRRNPYPFWSCLFWYTDIAKGADIGSYAQQYTAEVNTVGAVRHDQYDYVGTPAHIGSYPEPPSLYNEALKHRFGVAYTTIGSNYDMGYGAVIAVENALQQGSPVNVDLAVFSGVDGIFGPHAWIDEPPNWPSSPGLEGGHAVTLVKHFPHLCKQTSSGTVCGWSLAINSWGTGWLRNRNGNMATKPGHGGFILISDRALETIVYSLDLLHLTGQGLPQARRMPAYVGMPGGGRIAPPPPASPLHAGAVIGNWVAHVPARDVNEDLGPVINAAAHANNISAPGLLSVLGAECGIYTHSTQCDHVNGNPDTSFGACQVTVGTAAGFGLGNGIYDGYYGGNESAVRNYENVPNQCVWLAARVLGSYKSYLAGRPFDPCTIDFPALYVAWNAGPGNPCWYILNPTGLAGSNYYNDYLGWWSWAAGHARATNPYVKPTPFPRTSWGQRVPPYTHGTVLARAASTWLKHRGLGMAMSRKHVKGRPGYTKTTFQHGAVYCFDGGRGVCKVAS